MKGDDSKPKVAEHAPPQRNGPRLVVYLTALGTVMGIATIGLSFHLSRVLQDSHRRIDEIEHEAEARSNRIESEVMRCQTELISALDDRRADALLGSGVETLAKQLESEGDFPSQKLFTATQGLFRDLTDICWAAREWCRETRQNADLGASSRRDVERCLAAIHADIELVRGRERLQRIVDTLHFLEGDNQAEDARELIKEQLSHDSLGDLSRCLAEMRVIVERLVAETDPDQLATIRDNDISSELSRFKRQLARGRKRHPELVQKLAAHLRDLETALFGVGFVTDAEHQTIEVGSGGLFNRHAESLDLASDRRQLARWQRDNLAQTQTLRDSMRCDAESRAHRVNAEMEIFVQRGAVIFGVLCSLSGLCFVLLGYRVAKQIHRQIRDLDVAAAEARAANRAKSEFLANMSHEIRTPMNGVIGMASIVAETELNEQQREYVTTIQNSGKSLISIINDILDFSKVESGALELERIEFDLLTATEDVLELLAERAYSKGIELISYFGPDVPRRIRGDVGRLQQVLTNIIGNAIKFTEGGRVSLRVVDATESRDIDSVLRFEIEDSGIGIKEDEIETIFQAFAQADSSTTRRFGGTGLGLAISKVLVEAMGGTIEAQSVEGRGSRFSFTIRCERETDDGWQESFENLVGKRVLLVEDDPLARELMRCQLEAQGIQVHRCANGSEATLAMERACANKELDLVIVDFQLPDVSGVEIIESLRRHGCSCVPIIAASSVCDREVHEQAKKAGAIATLTKPVRLSQLIWRMNELLDRKPAKPAAQTEELPVVGLDVLLVEDNPVNQLIASKMLEKMQCRVRKAANGQEALDMLDDDVELVLMDCQMPVLDGYEATQLIRALEVETGRHLPIVAMTANVLAADRDRCLDAGMDDHIPKPVDLLSLGAKLIDIRARLIDETS